MPRRSPFTALCGQLAELSRPQRADLHVHTTASDGEFTPGEVVALAREAGLRAVAVTDHDTLAAVAEAQAAADDRITLVTGVEISASFREREVHLLGYFVRLDHAAVNARLAQVCAARRERFRDFVAKLADREARIPFEQVKALEESTISLGRRHVASLLAASGIARNRAEAFHRFVGPLTGRVLPKLLIPVEEAIHLVRDAGGVASLAHPSSDLDDEQFRTLAGMGLGALEVEYPWGRNAPTKQLRAMADRLGLAVSGGSDCHGPQPTQRRIGSRGINADELGRLQSLGR